jgi:DNA-directed RNA polymerase subunit beta'
MLEVNDFNAVRISLASPEQIRSWSYGEVTKPETINYRTLKPEKDGLFCEKIFGPTKDWECYCGKYKRVRYKGIVCDKCGVEVARAKVRRERMGHIELAAPVSHIWFVKGTPSRIGLLLDKSPRELERVLYFASYLVTAVDEDARQQALQRVAAEATTKAERAESTYQEEYEAITAELTSRREEIATKREEEGKAIAERLATELAELTEKATALEQQLQELVGQAAPHDISLGKKVIVREDAAVTRDHIATAQEEAREQRENLEQVAHADQQDSSMRLDAEQDYINHHVEERIAELVRVRDEETANAQQGGDQARKEIEAIHPLTLLAEGQYRELMDRHSQWRFFKAGMGAEAVRDVLMNINLDELRDHLRSEIRNAPAAGQRRKKANKRLRVVEAFRRSGNQPSWMVFTVLPVLPPDLRPMVQLDGGRFATSDLNDLYRRVINRNNRLRRLLELGAPEIIIRNEKRMLQEAVDSLIDNGRRGRAVSGSSNHKLKSLSDMLKGKQGRFRQNLLGKRVDYSGRSVIVVGPNLHLHQCGLPKRMALELFKPFVMRRLVEKGFAHNIKSAKRIVERVKPEVWDALEEVIQDHPVLLNRAPTLHRLGIQAFEPVLVDGSAIRIHPLVCAAFGADFDGDQMAVHVPLSAAAREEARTLMLSVYNLLSPSSGEPIVAPTLDMVLGCYYLTAEHSGAKGDGKVFGSLDEAHLAYDLGLVDLQAPITVRMPAKNGSDGQNEMLNTTIGRIIFNDILPEQMRFRNSTMDRKALRAIVGECYHLLGTAKTARLVDDIKRVGFDYATRSGITIAISDIQMPAERDNLLEEADLRIDEIAKQFRRGLITEEERYLQAIDVWTDARDRVTEAVAKNLDRFGSMYIMTTSGAKGNIQQLTQMAGMRGLMAAPSGRIIDLPIRSSFREGLTVLEYFISTHGARKGLADTAIRTADSGYLTRRLIDVAQDVIILEEDCGDDIGTLYEEGGERGVVIPLRDRVIGRYAAQPVVNEATGEIIVDRNEEIDEERMKEVAAAGIASIYARSPLSCQSRRGVCQLCYGRSQARGGW